jgi:molybdopterin adenylyltransferase
MKVGRVTCSDRASAGIYQDAGGPEIERVVTSVWPGPVEFVARIIPDDCAGIEATLRHLADEERCPLIITTGGTGFAARDVTPEATLAVLEKELPGFGEIMRSISFAVAPTAILSRATAGTRGRSLIINLPGNPKAIAQCLPPLVPAIQEALRHLAEQA